MDKAVVSCLTAISEAILSSEPLIGGLVLAEVGRLDPQVVGGRHHERKADDHVEVAHEVVPQRIIAANAQCVVHTLTTFDQQLALQDGDRRHCDPAKEESVQPYIKNPGEVVAGVLAADAIVGPEAVRVPAVDTLFADVAVVGAGGLDHLALEAEVLVGHGLQDSRPVEGLVLLHVAGRLLAHGVVGKSELGHADCGRAHEVPHVEHGLNHENVVQPNEDEQDQESDLVASVALSRNQGQLRNRAANTDVPGGRERIDKAALIRSSLEVTASQLLGSAAFTVLQIAIGSFEAHILADTNIVRFNGHVQDCLAIAVLS